MQWSTLSGFLLQSASNYPDTEQAFPVRAVFWTKMFFPTTQLIKPLKNQILASVLFWDHQFSLQPCSRLSTDFFSWDSQPCASSQFPSQSNILSFLRHPPACSRLHPRSRENLAPTALSPVHLAAVGCSSTYECGDQNRPYSNADGMLLAEQAERAGQISWHDCQRWHWAGPHWWSRRADGTAWWWSSESWHLWTKPKGVSWEHCWAL